MENASKALIMAGGMLLAILIVSLLIYAWSLFSDYQSSQDKLADIEDTARFNEQFTNYDRNDVEGYELISLVNQVVDYNQRKSNTGLNSENTTPIYIKINLKNETYRKQFTKDDTNRLIKQNSYIQSNSVNQFNFLISIVKGIENNFGGSDCALKIAKNIDSIFLSDAQIEQEKNKGYTEDEIWNIAIKRFNSFTNKTVSSETELKSKKEDALKYYEYIQFKRAVFKCTKLDYNQKSGHVDSLEFEYTGKIH